MKHNIKLTIILFSFCLLFSWVQANLNTVSQYDSKLVKRQTVTSSSDQNNNNNNNNIFYINQPLDHFNSNNNKNIIKQRYWVNSTFYKPGGPVLLFNPGESSIDPVIQSFETLSFRLLCEKLNALFITIEHRYYGQSLPNTGNEPPQWQYLTIEQSLEDMANLIKHGNELNGIPYHLSPKTTSTKWILRGGSYSGNLAAWMRSKYPDLVYAAVASSSPVQAQFDFYQYYIPIIKYAPRKCVKALNQIALTIDNFLAKHPEPSNENTQFKKQFGVRNESDAEFALDAMSAGLILWQQSFPQINYFDQMVCTLFKNSSDPKVHFENYAKFAKQRIEELYGYTNNNDNNNDQSNSTTTKRSFFKRANDNNNNMIYANAFEIQQCKQLGYFPTSPPKTSPYYKKRLISNLVTKDYYKQLCKNKYNITHTAISTTNRNYHGWHIQVSRTIWIEGKWDPWRELGVLSDFAPIKRVNATFEKYITIPEGIHTFDSQIYPTVNYVTDYTIKTLTEWLK